MNRGRTSFRHILLLVAAGAILWSCTESTGPALPGDSGPHILWQSLQARNYSIEQQRFCFCAGRDGKVKVTVRNGVVARVEDAESGTSLPPGEWAYYRSIDELFGLIEAARRDSGGSFTVIYDSAAGYPSSLFIDPDHQTADEEFGYVTGALVR